MGCDPLIEAPQRRSGLADQCDSQHKDQAEYKGIFTDLTAIIVPQRACHEGKEYPLPSMGRIG